MGRERDTDVDARSGHKPDGGNHRAHRGPGERRRLRCRGRRVASAGQLLRCADTRAAAVLGRAQVPLPLTEAAGMTWTRMAIAFGGLALALQFEGSDSVALRPTGRA